MNKKGIVVFNIIVILIMLFELYLHTTKNVLTNQTNGLFSKFTDSGYSFDLVTNPDYTKAKAGDEVNIKLKAENIKMGETGLNTIQGYLRYDETLFDEFTIEGIDKWVIEQNKYKDHMMYGKFVLYTMQEGTKEDQNVLNITLKLKQDLKPQTTKIEFYDLKTSEGNISVKTEDAIATIEIYEEKKQEDEVVPIDEGKVDGKEEDGKEEVKNVKTGDNIYIWFAVAIISLIILDAIVIIKNKKEKEGKGVKTKVVTITSVILLALILVAITSIANSTIIKELVASLNYKETWLDSSTYLVTDTEVSRIAPHTDASEIIEKFNKSIKLYEESDEEAKAITSGIVATGMKITDNQDIYGVSVLGDINGDGESDHVDLTNIIRNLVNKEKWALEGVEGISADINVDKTIEENDRNLEIKYILFGEMNIPSFEEVKAPKIEVVEGTYYDVIEAYETPIKVKVSNDDANAVKTMFKIDGSAGQTYRELKEDQFLIFNEDGVYKISAYSYGKDGNRSEINYEILVKKNPNKEYKVITHTKIRDSYTSSEETKIGRIGTTVEANVTIPEGYLLEREKGKLSGKLLEDEELILEVYLKPGYSVTYKPGTYGTFEEQVIENIDYGAETPSFTGELTCKEGYEFAGWDKEIAQTVTKNEVYTATWKAIEYTIEYELNGGILGKDSNGIDILNPEKYTVETPDFKLNNPVKEGYAFLGWTGTGLDSETEEVIVRKGSTGNRKYTANWEKVTGIVYNVEYYLENLTKNEYTLHETVERNGNLNQEVTATIKTYEGFTFDEQNENNVLTGTILNSGELVLKVYYKRNEYNLKLIAGEGIENVKLNTEIPAKEIEEKVRYEEKVNIDATIGEIAGYTLSFDKWESADTELLENIEVKVSELTMPAGDVILTALATKDAKNVNYLVEFYYAERGVYPQEVEEINKETRTGKTGTIAEITENDKVPSKAGYVYDENAEGKIESAEILADGTTTLKVYYKEQFTVTYKPGEYGAFEEKQEYADYNAEVPEYTGSLEGTNGYVFNGWTPEAPEKVTENLVFIATWKQMGTPDISHTPTTWTNQDVKVEITAPEEYVLHTIEYRVKGTETWTEYTGKFDIGENCIIEARLADGDNKGTIVEHEIANIDKVKPEASQIVVGLKEEDEAKITLKGTDNLSGIVEYAIKKSDYLDKTTYTCESVLSKDIEFDGIGENGTYILYLKDAAGNETEVEVEVNNIHYMVARIIAAPTGYEELIGTEYEKLELALATSDNAAQIGNVDILIIHDIANESNEIKLGRDYTIRPSEYTVQSRIADPVLTVNGKLKIIGNEETTNVERIGTIEGLYGEGIYISLTGNLTLGTDDGTLPSVYSPVIKGKTYGIEKYADINAGRNSETGLYPEGIFNFYDGIVIGGTQALKIQKVNDTPALYDPTVITNAETTNQEATLAIVSGIEALIGKKRYTLLEEAIYDANNEIGDSNTQIEITIVKDIIKQEIVIVDKTKNIKLDLNGYVLTTAAAGNVLENYGKLEVYDSSETIDEETGEIIPGTGKVLCSTAGGILNAARTSEDVVYEDIDLNTAVPNGNYYFEVNEEGKLVSNNAETWSTANGYIEIDLTDKIGIYETVINYEGGDSWAYGAITVTNTDVPVTYDDGNGRKEYFTSYTSNSESKFELTGGEKYYIHFTFRQSHVSANPKFIINNIKIGKLTEVGELTITSGIYESASSSSHGAIENQGILYVNGGTYTTTKNGVCGIYNGRDTAAGYTVFTNGKVNINRSYSDSYCVINNGNALLKLKNLSGNAGSYLYNTGYLYMQDGTLNIGEIYDRAITTAGRGLLYIKDYTIKRNTKGGTFIFDACNYKTYYGIVIDNAILDGAGTGIGNGDYWNSGGNILINKITLKNTSTGIVNGNADNKIDIKNIIANDVNENDEPTVSTAVQTSERGAVTTIDTCNVYTSGSPFTNGRNSNSVLIIKDGIVRTSGNAALIQNNLYNGYSNQGGKVYIYDGDFKAKSHVIYSEGDNSNIYVYGGTLESTDNIALYNIGGGSLTIGENDETISTINPVVKSPTTAVRNQLATFNFYDGVLIGTEGIVIDGVIDDMPEGVDVATEVKEDELEYDTLGIPTKYVAKIAETDNPDVTEIDTDWYKLENGYYYFKNLNMAVEACNTVNATTIEIIDTIYINKKVLIDEGQDITINMNNHPIYLRTRFNFENNGKVKITNSEEHGQIIGVAGQVIKNNENAKFELENISISYRKIRTGSRVNIIDNYGIMNVNNVTYNVQATNSSINATAVYNEDGGIFNANKLKITGNIGNEASVIFNNGKDIEEDNETIYSITMKNSTITISDNYSYSINNNSQGTILLDTCSVSGSEYRGNCNNSSGTIIIDNTIVTNITKNTSSGKIVIKGDNTDISNPVSNSSSGILEIQGGRIHQNSGYNRLIFNEGTVIMTGGEISDERTNNYDYCPGIYNRYSSSKIIITGGTVRSNYVGIDNYGILIMGTEDGITEYVPKVYGGTTGVYNPSTMEFYGGIVEGPNTSSITGKIPEKTEPRTMRVIHKGEMVFDDGTIEKYNVAEGREISVIERVYIAELSNGQRYENLAEAVENAADTDTITIIHDASIAGTVESVTIPDTKNITLDLNGYNILAANNGTIINNGTLLVKDSTSHLDEDGKRIEGTFINSGNNIFENNGSLTFDSGKFGLSLGTTYQYSYNLIKNNGKLTINDGRFYVSGNYSRIIYSTSGDIEIKDGTFTGSGQEDYHLLNDGSDCNISIKGGTFNQSSYNSKIIYNNKPVTIDITGGTFSYAGNIAIYNASSGTINMSSCTVSGQIQNNGLGIINITSGTYSGANSGQLITNENGGTINITGGTITGSIRNSGISSGTVNISNDINGSIENVRTGTINITKGIVSGNVNNYDSATLNIDGRGQTAETPIKINGSTSVNNTGSGTVNIKGYVELSATSTAINNSGTGTINIGEEDAPLTYNMKINSSGTGINNFSGNRNTINYYDGVITAKTAVYGYINAIPEGYDIVRSVDENSNEIYELKSDLKEICSVGNNIYDTLQDAIDANNGGTITLLKGLVFATSNKVEIPSEKGFSLDLNGSLIKVHSWDEIIDNKGILNIVDSTNAEDYLIYGFSKKLINNEGTLEIKSGTIQIIHVNKDSIINNTGEGKTKISGGTLYSRLNWANQDSYIIYSDNANKVEITGGTFRLYGMWGGNNGAQRSDSYVVYCTAENADVEITGGNYIHENSGRTYIVKTIGVESKIKIEGTENEITSNLGFAVYTEKTATIDILGKVNINTNGDSEIWNSASVYMKGSDGAYPILNVELDEDYHIFSIKTSDFSGSNRKATINLIKGTVQGGTPIYSDNNSQIVELNVYDGAVVNASDIGIHRIRIINMYGGSINGRRYGIYEDGYSEINILGGTINATNGPGIYINSGILTLGENTGGYPSQTVPEIKGSTYGIQNAGGTFNFYDGVLKGNTNALYGNVTETPELFSVIYSADETVATLGIKATFEQIASVNGIYFDSIESAVDAAMTSESTMEICKNIILENPITVPEGKELTIDMAGYYMYGYVEGAVITNNGTLVIVDSTNTDGTSVSTIKNYAGMAIENNGNATIGVNDGTVYTNAPIIIGKTVAINNKGTLTVFDGKFGKIEEEGTIIDNTGTIMAPAGYSLQEASGYWQLVEN
ncbi:MAG: hypothetical protein J6M60_02840 [Clostridia bacterium]|nr:hypothetical protein [Clostridia bacterium]